MTSLALAFTGERPRPVPARLPSEGVRDPAGARACHYWSVRGGPDASAGADIHSGSDASGEGQQAAYNRCNGYERDKFAVTRHLHIAHHVHHRDC